MADNKKYEQRGKYYYKETNGKLKRIGKQEYLDNLQVSKIKKNVKPSQTIVNNCTINDNPNIKLTQIKFKTAFKGMDSNVYCEEYDKIIFLVEMNKYKYIIKITELDEDQINQILTKNDEIDPKIMNIIDITKNITTSKLYSSDLYEILYYKNLINKYPKFYKNDVIKYVNGYIYNLKYNSNKKKGIVPIKIGDNYIDFKHKCFKNFSYPYLNILITKYCNNKNIKTLTDLSKVSEITPDIWYKVLNNCVKKLIKYYKAYNFIHWDLHNDNMLYELDKNKPIFFDFDLSEIGSWKRKYSSPLTTEFFKRDNFLDNWNNDNKDADGNDKDYITMDEFGHWYDIWRLLYEPIFGFWDNFGNKIKLLYINYWKKNNLIKMSDKNLNKYLSLSISEVSRTEILNNNIFKDGCIYSYIARIYNDNYHYDAKIFCLKFRKFIQGHNKPLFTKLDGKKINK